MLRLEHWCNFCGATAFPATRSNWFQIIEAAVGHPASAIIECFPVGTSTITPDPPRKSYSVPRAARSKPPRRDFVGRRPAKFLAHIVSARRGQRHDDDGAAGAVQKGVPKDLRSDETGKQVSRIVERPNLPANARLRHSMLCSLLPVNEISERKR